MHIKSLLNKVEKHKGFIYESVELVTNDSGEESLEVRIRPHQRNRPQCSGCGKKRGCYDTRGERRFEFVPLWGIAVFFLYTMRRVNCPKCGIVIEEVPWGNGKRSICNSYAWFLAHWASKLSWTETAKSFRTSWHIVFCSVEMAVNWGRKRLDKSSVTAIGVDEIAWQKGHHYLTLVYQINDGCRRLLWVGEHRKVKTLLRFFRWLGKKQTLKIEFVCSDLWQPYLKVITKKASQAIHVLDRFHLIQRVNKAIDQIRAEEARKMKEQGYEPLLKGSRWCLLKKKDNLTEKQASKLKELMQYNLKIVRGYLLKEELDQLWQYVSPTWAGKFLDSWCNTVMRSKLEPMKKIARSVRNNRDLILNWFHAKGQISNGVVEGFNCKAKLTTRTAYGFRTFRAAEVALLHALGNLPQPDHTHSFF